MSETYADKATRVTHELRAVIGEAHAAIKDLSALLKEIREVRADWEVEVAGLVRPQLEGMLQTHLATIKQELDRVGNDTTRKMYDRFDKIMAILMGEEKGVDETMDDLARQVKAAMGQTRRAGADVPPVLRKRTL